MRPEAGPTGGIDYVVSGTLDRVDWNAELVQGELGKAVQDLKGSLAEACSWEA